MHTIPEGVLPIKRIYINKDAIEPLNAALNEIKEKNLTDLIKSYDGCFNIRKKRGGITYSLHSWAIAIDINARENSYGRVPRMPMELVECFTNNGWEWGGYWKKPDGMHFQLKHLK